MIFGSNDEQENGQTQGIIAGRGQAICSDFSERQGSFDAQSQAAGIQGCFSHDQELGCRTARYNSLQSVYPDIGKILERLDVLEKKFSSYVKSHQERLDLRKQESVVAEEDFLRESAELRTDIISLISSQLPSE